MQEEYGKNFKYTYEHEDEEEMNEDALEEATEYMAEAADIMLDLRQHR